MATNSHEHPLGPKKQRWFLRLVAAAVVLATVLFLVYQQQHTKGPALYNQYFKPYPAIVAAVDTREAREPKYRKRLRSALRQYQDGHYVQAADSLVALTEIKPENDTLNLYIGMCHMARQEVPKAQAYLAKVAVRSQSPLQRDAQWYLALGHLHEENIELAEQLLQPLAKNRGRFHKRAAALRDVLK